MIATNLNEMQAKTGRVKFNSNGDRIDTEFDILNINSRNEVSCHILTRTPVPF